MIGVNDCQYSYYCHLCFSIHFFVSHFILSLSLPFFQFPSTLLYASEPLSLSLSHSSSNIPISTFAEVMSADCFAAFEEAGLDNEVAVRATGKRFRETVLAMGGGKHPSDVYKAFRGRDPDPAALLRHTGLTK